MRDRLNVAVRKVVSNDDSTKNELQDMLGFDDLNMSYFISLFDSYLNPKEKKKLVIGKNVFPTAIAPKELMKELPYVDYKVLLDSDYSDHARKAKLWIKKMQAGTGSSIVRTSYLADICNVSKKKVNIGSKGTDLFIEDGICLAEVQIMQAIFDTRSNVYSKIMLHDIVSRETQSAVLGIWDKPSFIDPSKTYLELMDEESNLMRSGETFQSHQPTIDEEGDLSTNRESPGGHGLFAVDALRAAYIEKQRPDSAEGLIGIIGNGEDLSSTPDPLMIGWMLKNKIPIAMLTTEKTELDMKGGQIALVKENNVYVTIIEKAQAEASGQLKLFEELGLRSGDGIAFFNTNLAMFNYEVITPMIEKLVAEIGENEFMRIVTPDLIKNKKEQTDSNRVVKEYIQLEGAMGSSILNLDRFWREHYGEPIVHFINIDKSHRTRFFSAVKTAFDFFIQFYSDRFVLNKNTMRLENLRAGYLPSVTLKDEFYDDVKNVLDAFCGVSTINLDKLYIEGKVTLSGAVLKGNVEIINKSSKLLDLTKHYKKGKFILDNVRVEIMSDSEIKVTNL